MIGNIIKSIGSAVGGAGNLAKGAGNAANMTEASFELGESVAKTAKAVESVTKTAGATSLPSPESAFSLDTISKGVESPKFKPDTRIAAKIGGEISKADGTFKTIENLPKMFDQVLENNEQNIPKTTPAHEEDTQSATTEDNKENPVVKEKKEENEESTDDEGKRKDPKKEDESTPETEIQNLLQKLSQLYDQIRQINSMLTQKFEGKMPANDGSEMSELLNLGFKNFEAHLTENRIQTLLPSLPPAKQLLYRTQLTTLKATSLGNAVDDQSKD